MAKLYFTKRSIDEIVPAEKNLSFTDTRQRGLSLIVTPNGVKTFYLVRNFNGRTERTRIGRFPDTTIQQARNTATALHRQYDQGVNPTEVVRKERPELTLDEFFEIYFRDHCVTRNKRPESTRDMYRLHVGPRFGRWKLSEITRSHIIDLHSRIGGTGKTRTANKAQGLLRAIYNKAMAWEYYEGSNPATHVERFQEHSRERYLLPEELVRFHRALDKEPDGDIRDYFQLLLLTGARKSELMAMRWDHLDLDDGYWIVPEPENGHPRIVALAAPARAILGYRKLQVAHRSGWVFPGTGKTGHVVDVKRAWERLLNRAGILDLRIHDLRRTHGSWMLATGADIPTIGKALGHKDPSSTHVYARTYFKPVQQAVDRAAAKLMAQFTQEGGRQ